MLSVVTTQQPTKIVVHLSVDKISVTKSNIKIDSNLGTEVIRTTIRPINIFSNNDTKIYVEPFVYIDGGLYDSEGTPVDAEYYNTAFWAVTYNGGYVS